MPCGKEPPFLTPDREACHRDDIHISMRRALWRGHGTKAER